MARLTRVVVILFLGVLLASCTREMDEPSHLQFDLSHLTQGKVGAQSTSQEISFVAINISGPGMDRVICRFDEVDDFRVWVGPCEATPENPFSVVVPNIPSGDGRLIQVLAIVEEYDAQGIEQERFNYGEAFQGLAAGDNAINIQLQQAPAVTNKDGVATGRYLFSDGTGYTGKVALEFAPPSGSAPMVVFNLEMFAGWFEIYILDNIPLRYRMLEGDAAGHVMFGGPVDQQSTSWNPTTSVLQLESPMTYGNDGPELGERMVLGFWRDGQPDASGSVCYDSTAEYSEYDYTDSAGTNTLSFPNDFITNGGSGTCPLTFPLVSSTSMNFNGKLVLEGRGEGLIFSGPYQVFQGTSGEPTLVDAFASGTQMTVSWKYLPGVTSDPEFAGSSLFYSDSYSGDAERELEGGEGFECEKLLDRPEDGFIVEHVSGSAESVVINTPTEMAHKGVVFICPRKANPEPGDNPYFATPSATGVNKAPAVDLKISGPGFDYPYVNNNACTQLDITAVDANGNEGEFELDHQNPYAVSLSESAGGTFYDQPFCDLGGSGISTIGMTHTNQSVWYKINSTPPLSMDPGVTALAGQSVTLTSDTWTGLQVVTSSLAAQLEVFAPSEVSNTEECFPMIVAHTDVNSVPVAAGAVTVQMSSSAGNDFHSFADSSCTSAADTDADLSTGKSYAFYFYKVNTGGLEVTDTLTAVDLGAGVSSGVANMDLVRPPDATYMYPEDNNSWSSGGCFAVYLTTYINSDGNGPSPKSYPPQPLEYEMSASDPSIQFFSENSCSSSLTNNRIQQSTNQTAAVVYVKPTGGSGSYTVYADELNIPNEDEFDNDFTFSY